MGDQVVVQTSVYRQPVKTMRQGMWRDLPRGGLTPSWEIGHNVKIILGHSQYLATSMDEWFRAGLSYPTCPDNYLLCFQYALEPSI
jgi:hypothetical protein